MDQRPLVSIIGAGALGSHLVQFVRNEKADIRVVDFDRVEQKNVVSQFHGKPGVGKLKVLGLGQTMDLLFGRRLITNSIKLVSNNADVLLGGAKLAKKVALIVDCVDNGETRRVIQHHAISHGIPCVHGALAANGEFGRVAWTENFKIDDETTDAPTCENGEFLPMICITAAYLARAVQIFFKEGKKLGFQVSPVGTVAV